MLCFVSVVILYLTGLVWKMSSLGLGLKHASSNTSSSYSAYLHVVWMRVRR